MTVIRKTISLTTQQDDWIKQRLAGGDYTNESEYLRDLIRHDQEDQSEIQAIRDALIKGEESGEPVSFNLLEFQQAMHDEKKAMTNNDRRSKVPAKT